MWTRIITALLLAPAAILGTLYLPNPWFAVALLGVLGLGLIEWGKICGLSNAAGPGWLALTAVVAGLLFRYDATLVLACFAGSGFWLMRGLALYRKGLGDKPGQMACAAEGWLVVTAAWSGLVLLQRQADGGPALALLVLLLVWSADSLAYFTGRSFGRRKLAPAISPGKTVEGALGGMAGVLLVALAAGLFYFHHHGPALLWWLLISLFAGMFSVVGDLNESRLKRLAGVKDSGAILPGHGGVLDRVDGLLAAVPLFAAGWYIGRQFGWF